MAEMKLEGMDARPEDSAFALGRVHSIETMGTVDGPGIRFVVFVQGCPMRCAYCHNPDTWSVNGGTMVTVEHLIDEFQSNHEFYRSGGITVSGGEPLLQPEFLADLFRAMHNNPDGRVHTCLDSCGYAFDPAHPEKFDAVLNETDMVLLDIKHADPVEHKKLTGCVQTVSILHRRHFFIFAFYFSITTVLSVSAGRSTRMICPLTRRKQPESSFVRFSRITT